MEVSKASEVEFSVAYQIGEVRQEDSIRLDGDLVRVSRMVFDRSLKRPTPPDLLFDLVVFENAIWAVDRTKNKDYLNIPDLSQRIVIPGAAFRRAQRIRTHGLTGA